MELNMPNPDSLNLPEAFGISNERQKELSGYLNDMVEGLGDELVLVTAAHVIRRIAAFCEGREEFAYCIILHMGWHQRRGMQLTPRGATPNYILEMELAEEFAKWLDVERNKEGESLWKRKDIWGKVDAFERMYDNFLGDRPKHKP